MGQLSVSAFSQEKAFSFLLGFIAHAEIHWTGSNDITHYQYVCEKRNEPRREKTNILVSKTNQAVQLQKMAKDLKFWIKKVEGLYYLCSKNKGADLALFSHMQNVGFLMTRLKCKLMNIEDMHIPGQPDKAVWLSQLEILASYLKRGYS